MITNTKDIRDAVVSRITGVTGAGSNVFNSKVTPNLFTNLPAICVYTPSQTAAALDHRNPAFQRIVDLQIEVNVAAAVDWSDEMDDIMLAIKNALFEDSTFVELFEDIGGYTEQHSVEDAGEQPMALGQLTIEVTLVEASDAGR